MSCLTNKTAIIQTLKATILSDTKCTNENGVLHYLLKKHKVSRSVDLQDFKVLSMWEYKLRFYSFKESIIQFWWETHLT